MKSETQEMIARLRDNHEKNMRNYEKQAQKAEERISKQEKLATENFGEAVELRRKHLKAK
ncbi:MAG: hypothetical protein HFJ41_01735 [Clostridia bacterium]|nr:hypothetical protein [Clostridia bacterium]